MKPDMRDAARGLSISLAVIAFVVGAFVVRQSMATDDGGPPIAALCAGGPAFILLIAAGAVWPRRDKR